jgi:hypothetical protein
MKRSTFVAIFVCTNLAFLMLHIHKQSQVTKLSYEKQKRDQEINTLEKRKCELTHDLQTVHDRTLVKQFAVNKLDLKPVKIAQIKKVNEA